MQSKATETQTVGTTKNSLNHQKILDLQIAGKDEPFEDTASIDKKKENKASLKKIVSK